MVKAPPGSRDVVISVVRQDTLSILSQLIQLKFGTGTRWELTWNGQVFFPATLIRIAAQKLEISTCLMHPHDSEMD